MEKKVITVDFKLINMKHEKVTSILGNHLELHENHLEYFVHFLADVPNNIEDELLGISEKEVFRLASCVKKEVSIVTMDLTQYDQWNITICNNTGEDVYLYYKSTEFLKAKEAYEIIKNWINN